MSAVDYAVYLWWKSYTRYIKNS